MPTGGRNDAGTGLRYYSWEAGPVHFISVDSFYGLFGPLQYVYTQQPLTARRPLADAAPSPPLLAPLAPQAHHKMGPGGPRGHRLHAHALGRGQSARAMVQ